MRRGEREREWGILSFFGSVENSGMSQYLEPIKNLSAAIVLLVHIIWEQRKAEDGYHRGGHLSLPDPYVSIPSQNTQFHACFKRLPT